MHCDVTSNIFYHLILISIFCKIFVVNVCRIVLAPVALYFPIFVWVKICDNCGYQAVNNTLEKCQMLIREEVVVVVMVKGASQGNHHPIYPVYRRVLASNKYVEPYLITFVYLSMSNKKAAVNIMYYNFCYCYCLNRQKYRPWKNWFDNRKPIKVDPQPVRKRRWKILRNA